MLCSPMMIPPHPPRRFDPLWDNSRLVRICQNHVVNSWAQEKIWKCHLPGGVRLGLWCRNPEDCGYTRDLT